MSPSLSKRQANRQRWFDCIETWKQSGLTQKAFCEQQQLGLGSFQRWRGIFMRGGKAGNPSSVRFVPVNVTVAKVSSLALLIDGHLRIEIPAGFDPVTLQQVVQVLQAS